MKRGPSKDPWSGLSLPGPSLRKLKAFCRDASPNASRTKRLISLVTGRKKSRALLVTRTIASELELEIFHIDLSEVISKYIGETEKNLNRIFDRAEASDAILFFDEADALFGKRSSEKESHDRYNNLEFEYLLQRMEASERVVILALKHKPARRRRLGCLVPL